MAFTSDAMTRPPIVLVHGAWAGAWAWRPVLAPLRAAGHEVHAVTLTGCGERRHLMRADISLRTHIDDVLELVEAEELRDLVLVGHSYAGLVVTGAAHALRARDPALLRQVVYVDAMVPLSGECWSSRHSEQVKADRSAAAQASGCNALPPPDPAGFGLSGAGARLAAAAPVPAPLRRLPRSAARRGRGAGATAAGLHRRRRPRLSDDRTDARAGAPAARLQGRADGDRSLPADPGAGRLRARPARLDRSSGIRSINCPDNGRCRA